MSPEVLFGLYSVAAAALFFTAGRLANHRRQTIALREAYARAGEERERTVRARSERDSLEKRLHDVPALAAEVDERRAEIARWRQRVTEVEARLHGAGDPEILKALRADVAAKGTLLAACEQRAQNLEQQNASLRAHLAAQATLAAAPHPHAENARPTTQVGMAPRARVRTPLPEAGQPSRAGALGALVERVSALGDVRSAVIADDLGLVVVSHGELGDEVAVIGSILGRAAIQAQRLLPLGAIERLTIEDDQSQVLMVHPLGIEDLTLVTLAVSGGLDPRVVSKLIEEGPGSAS
jgi:predicted regulator of Ras-like GTPase activity (Roadblock/LC7/MglB family)